MESSLECIGKLALGITRHTFMLIIRRLVQFSASIQLKLMEGSMPKRQRRLIEAWAELHQDELVDDWTRLQSGRRPQPIAPLK